MYCTDSACDCIFFFQAPALFHYAHYHQDHAAYLHSRRLFAPALPYACPYTRAASITRHEQRYL